MKRRLLGEIEAQIAMVEMDISLSTLDIDRNMGHAKKALLEKVKSKMEGYPIHD